jgi:hypothetical protein
MFRTVVLSAALVAALVASASADETAAERYYKARIAKVEKQAAMRLWDAAEKARGASLFKFAREEARRVLDLDPDNAKARAFLGYVKKDAGWEIDLAQSGKLPTENVQTTNGPRLVDAEPAWRTLAAKADLDVAAIYASFGDECAAKSYRAEAETAYGKALALDPESPSAHRGLGHVKLAEGLWLPSADARAFEAARIARPVDAASYYDQLFETKLNKAESAHFRVECDFDQKAIAGYLDACEKTYAAYLVDMGLPSDTDVFAKPRVFCVMSADAQWDKWVNRIVQYGNQGFYRGLMCHLARDRGVCGVRNFEGATDEKRRDRLMHQSAHFMNYALFDVPDGCWVDDAIAYRYPILLTGTSYAFCLAPRKEDYAKTGAEPNWSDPTQWKAMLKEMVAKKDDAELRLIVTKRSYDLPIVASIKAWSVVDLLLKRDRKAFVAMLRETKDTKDFVTLLETRFGKSVEAIDDEWRKWVLATY